MVSVVVPAYNMEKYLAKCLDALIAQSYEDIEIIVIDDGSTDGTLRIAGEYSEKDTRIKVFSKENGGVSSARNLGIDKASGEYITFADPDDIIEQNGIEVLFKAMKSSGAELVSCMYSRWSDAGERLEDFDFITGIKSFYSDDDKINFILSEIADYLFGYEVWDKLYKTRIIKENHIRFYEKCKIGEDLAFNIKYLINIKCIDNISDRVVRYNIRNDSAMGEHKNLLNRITENDYMLRDIYSYISEKGNKTFTDKFPLIYIRLMDSSFWGHTPAEIVDTCKNMEDIFFMQEMYTHLLEYKKDLLWIFPDDIAGIKFKYHKYIKSCICNDTFSDKAERFIYDFYRILRRRETIKNWKMPY